jgi:hypothetical protein
MFKQSVLILASLPGAFSAAKGNAASVNLNASVATPAFSTGDRQFEDPYCKPGMSGDAKSLLNMTKINTITDTSANDIYTGEFVIVDSILDPHCWWGKALAASARLSANIEKLPVVGIDFESGDKDGVALIQIAVPAFVLLYRAHDNREMPEFILDILTNPEIIKVAVGYESQDDVMLATRYPSQLCTPERTDKCLRSIDKEGRTAVVLDGLVELQTVAQSVFPKAQRAKGFTWRGRGVDDWTYNPLSFEDILLPRNLATVESPGANIKPIKNGYFASALPKGGWFRRFDGLTAEMMLYAAEDAFFPLYAFLRLVADGSTGSSLSKEVVGRALVRMDENILKRTHTVKTQSSSPFERDDAAFPMAMALPSPNKGSPSPSNARKGFKVLI